MTPPMTYSRAVEIVEHHHKNHAQDRVTGECFYQDCDDAKLFLSGWDARRLVDAEIAKDWRKFYESMQAKSKLGEKDGLYRAFAAEDILTQILNHQPAPREGK